MSFLPDKYRPFPPIALPDRRWPSRVIQSAPLWCSVDLRDGNQALVEPMGMARKRRFFESLVRTGFREIEVGFPAASQTDFDFVRQLITEGRIPDDVTIQVLTQARAHLIARTFEALKGAKRAIVHLYNSTSTLQRRVVFCQSRDEIRQLAVDGTRLIKQAAQAATGSEILLEYSPESFSATELDFAAEVCDAVADEWGATPDNKVIINLPATVEMASPNVFADQVEWMTRHLRRRDCMIVSVHTHNDRGCAVAAAELALLAGAERVEGTLFGNGERTGNADLITLALNLYSQGISPGLDLSDVPALVEAFEACNRLPVHPRHPYAGELVFTAFSGSHQDAIRKGLEAMSDEQNPFWEVPYLPIDPGDLGRKYEPLIRINSQSGKGGLAFVLERAHGYRVPKALAVEFSQQVQQLTDASGEEITPAALFELFERQYINPQGSFTLGDYELHHLTPSSCQLSGNVTSDGEAFELKAEGSGPIDAFVKAINARVEPQIAVTDYSEHSLGNGADAEAVAYVELRSPNGRKSFGVGRDADIVRASLRAVVSGVNRLSHEQG